MGVWERNCINARTIKMIRATVYAQIATKKTTTQLQPILHKLTMNVELAVVPLRTTPRGPTYLV